MGLRLFTAFTAFEDGEDLDLDDSSGIYEEMEGEGNEPELVGCIPLADVALRDVEIINNIILLNSLGAVSVDLDADIYLPLDWDFAE